MIAEVVECVSFLLVQQDSLLVETRRQDKESDAGKCAIPGGRMEAGENKPDTLLREMMEELDVQPTKYNFLCSLYHASEQLYLIHYYLVLEWQGEIKALEAAHVDWQVFTQTALDLPADQLALAEYLRLQQVHNPR